ncbi:MAG: fimbrial biogenesis outer membrane usher protein [Kluyvera sp.]|uniref:fimbrial biogenesis outer membrane usher protein n=1 Tax=Kluyvera sp. TaxID=1538228 RepID=UPI003A850446
MLRMAPFVSTIVFSLFVSGVQAEEETFDTHFMMGGMQGVKTDSFQLNGDRPIAGEYELDVYVNQQWRGKYTLNITEDTQLTLSQLQQMGINVKAFGDVNTIPLAQAVQGGSYTFDISVFRLDLRVPQAYVNQLEEGYVVPENWQRGINAFYTSYYASQYYSDYHNAGSSKNSFVRFNSGLNLLGWQLHSDASFSQADNDAGVWKSNTLYLERSFASILGVFRAGEMYTSADLFDAVRFRGVRLFHDLQMQPNSKQNFAPLVQGIAQSNALVTVEQNGFVVYQKEVPPGPFAIADLQLAGGGGDLDVTVKEADGTLTQYLVPYGAVPNMLQPGVAKYDVVAGRSQIEGASRQSDFSQLSYQYGLNSLLTLYGGAMLADSYNAFTLGSGWNTRWGAFSLDAVRSHSRQDNGTFDGQSYQLAYNKYINRTATHFGLAAYRYSSRDYRTFNDHVWANNKDSYTRERHDVYDIGDYYQNDFGRKNSVSANVSQPLAAGWGAFSLSLLWRDYWQRGGHSEDYQLSYSNSWQRVAWTFSASQTYADDRHEDKRFNIFISIPFTWGDGITSARRQLSLSNSTTFDNDGFAANNTGVSGTFGQRDQFNYGVNLSHQRQHQETTAGANMSWNTPVAMLGGSYSQSSQYRQMSGNLSGGMVLWSGGLNLANRLTETVAILDAPGLEGAYVNGQKYRTTNRHGTVVYDNLSPYRENHLTLDVSDSATHTELLGNRKSVAPVRGAVVLAHFDTDTRRPWFIKAQRADGTPLTFGDDVEDERGHNVGLVGQGSRLFIRTDELPPSVTVARGKSAGQRCVVAFEPPVDEQKIYICH